MAQLILCLIIAILSSFFYNNNRATHDYIIWDENQAIAGTTSFFAYFVLINTMIPISLIVSIEIVKVTQSYFIDKDQFMFS